ncbi:hypothetical protein OROMI_019780 [Orobanche minor]
MTAVIKFMNMKPCILLLPSKNAPFLGVSLPKSSNFSSIPNYFSTSRFPNHQFHTSAPHSFGLKGILSRTQKRNSAFSSTWGQSRVFSSTCCCSISRRPRTHFLVARAAPDLRNLSTSSVESRVNDKNFERIYVQGGINAKNPAAAAEKIDAASGDDERVEGGGIEGDVRKSECSKEAMFVEVGMEESEVEKEAWRLLSNAVVTYCGSPVGTVAANDPNGKTPLNYDQVFIRDFIPSAFAFLLKGEGEIVRNFLLHTLQLQWKCCLKNSSLVTVLIAPYVIGSGTRYSR